MDRLTPKERNKLWERKIRPMLKKRFEGLGVTRCEKCGNGDFLGFAHRYKRRFITTVAELELAALLCVVCHHEIEYGGNMFAEIHAIICNRQSIECPF